MFSNSVKNIFLESFTTQTYIENHQKFGYIKEAHFYFNFYILVDNSFNN